MVPDFWPSERISENRRKFAIALKNATVAKRDVFLEVLMPVSSPKSSRSRPVSYRETEIHFAFYFRKSDIDQVKSFVAFDTAALVFGVFLSKDEADYYAGLFPKTTPGAIDFPKEVRDEYLETVFVSDSKGDVCAVWRDLSLLAAIQEKPDVLTEISQMQNSLAGKLRSIVDNIQVYLRAVSIHKQHNDPSAPSPPLLSTHLKLTLRVLCDFLDRPSTPHASGLVARMNFLVNELEQKTSGEGSEPGLLQPQMLIYIKELMWHCKSIQFSVALDMTNLCPNTKKFLEELRTESKIEAPHFPTIGRERNVIDVEAAIETSVERQLINEEFA
eukprot:154012_1